MCDVTTLNPNLVKKAEEFTGIPNSKEAVEYILNLYFEKNNKKNSLYSQNTNIFDDNGNENQEKPTAIGGMTKKELDAELKKGVESLKSDRTYTVNEVDAEFFRNFGI
ncbi:MAG: type II toxin-antitoxin system antitoxin, RelB/DinJ family [Candidatus Riflebacteria bacterium]|nr:type II toxin-antitoxin system antitoxin, RelB/DinJ family [Candidatus Riflebacteria bacterium]